MKSTTQPLSAVLQKFRQHLPENQVNELARQSGFMQRQSRKISPMNFVLGFFLALGSRLSSLNGWAYQITSLSGKPLKKQSLDDRLTGASSAFARRLLQQLLRLRVNLSRELKAACSAFRSVLVQDSTTLSLQQALACWYKGNVSGGVQKAVVRIKAVIELCTGEVRQLAICPYSHNDQAAASNIHALVRRGTLVIRDLGYWGVDSLKKITRRGGFFLSRLRFGTNLYDRSGQPLLPGDLLRGKAVDRWVLLGREHRLAVRFIAVPVSAEVAERRIRTAKNNRDRRLHHPPAYYEFLRYNVLVTNATRQQLSARAAVQLYSLRWQIEIFFKGLKSQGLHLPEMVYPVRTNHERVTTVLYLALCLVVLTAQMVYLPFKDRLRRTKEKWLSFVRVLAWVCQHLISFASLNDTQLELYLEHYCCYEKRKRKNMSQKIQSLT